VAGGKAIWSLLCSGQSGTHLPRKMPRDEWGIRFSRAAVETHVSEARHGAPDFEEG